MTSMQYQVLLMKVRHIYRWDDPLETAIFLGAYIFLWLIGHLAGAAVSFESFSLAHLDL